MFYEQLKIDNICNFFPQNDLLLENRNTLKSGPDTLLVFQQIKIKLAPLEEAYLNNNANLKG